MVRGRGLIAADEGASERNNLHAVLRKIDELAAIAQQEYHDGEELRRIRDMIRVWLA